MDHPVLLELKDVSQDFTLESGRKVRALERINLVVHDNEVLVLLGPSGSGKSTCLRIMAGLVQPTQGKVYIEDSPMAGVNGALSLVFQHFSLLPWLNVEQNIALGINIQKLPRKSAIDRVHHVIDLVGLEGFEEAYPRELSGGMKQRVGLARALIMDRVILALDEPFSALDVLTAESLRKEVVNVWLSRKTKTRSMVLVTHNIAEAVSMGSRIVVMGSGPGHVRYIIDNKLAYPRTEKSIEFRRMVEELHDVLTAEILPESLPKGKDLTDDNQVEAIPPVTVMELTGFLEAIHAEGGEVHALTLAQKMARDAVHILVMAHVAEMMEFVDTPKNIILLKEMGRQFVTGDVNTRKKLVHSQLLTMPLTQFIIANLKNYKGERMHRSDAEELIHSRLPNESPAEALKTLIDWGRFGELLGYSDVTKHLYLNTGSLES
jgi:NitT/TauT family transport system ATP-binding protein